MCERCHGLRIENDQLREEIEALKLERNLLRISLTAERCRSENRNLTVNEAAEALRVSSATVRREMEAGRLGYMMVANRRIIPFDCLIEYQKKVLIDQSGVRSV